MNRFGEDQEVVEVKEGEDDDFEDIEGEEEVELE